MDPQKNQDEAPDKASENPPTPTPEPTANDISLSEDKGVGSDSMPTSAFEIPVIPSDVNPTVDDTAPIVPVQTMSSPSQKKSKMIALIVGVVLLVLGGGGAAAYFGYYLPNKPDNILKKALVNSFSEEKAKTAHFEGEIAVTSKSDDQTLKGSFSGASSTEGPFDLSLTMDILVAELTFDARSVDGSSIYLRLGGLEGLPELLASQEGVDASIVALYAPIIASINNQWLEINESLLKEWGGGDLKMSKEDIQKLAKAFQDNSFLKVKEVLADEKIKDVNSYHYKVVVDKTKLKGFLIELKAAKVESLHLTDEQIDAFIEALDDSSLNFDKYPLEVWIAKDSKMFKQFAFNYSDSDVLLKITVTVISYNKAVEVEKPEDAKSIMEVLSDLFTSTSAAGMDLQQSFEEGFQEGLELQGGSGSGVSL